MSSTKTWKEWRCWWVEFTCCFKWYRLLPKTPEKESFLVTAFFFERSSLHNSVFFGSTWVNKVHFFGLHRELKIDLEKRKFCCSQIFKTSNWKNDEWTQKWNPVLRSKLLHSNVFVSSPFWPCQLNSKTKVQIWYKRRKVLRLMEKIWTVVIILICLV